MRTKRKGRQGWMVLKVDLEKAYDRFKWPFIEVTLTDLGVEEWMVRAIMACITIFSFQVLWNGDSTNIFLPTRGILQGDPISLYFHLCMERLNHIIRDDIIDHLWPQSNLARGGPPNPLVVC